MWTGRQLVELKTKKVGTDMRKDVWPQMFLSGTDKLVMGWQNYGYVAGLV